MSESSESFELNKLFSSWWPKDAFLNYVRSDCTADEVARMGELSEHWDESRRKFIELCQTTRFMGKTIHVSEVPMEYMSKINKILNSKNVRKQFNQLPIEIKMVEIDKLILPQNSVNMHDVEDMIKKFPKKLDMDALIHICFEAGDFILPTSEIFTPNYALYSSHSMNLKFLGATSLDVDTVGIDNISVSGTPTKAVLLVFGYGAAPIYGFGYGGRVFLHNGCHRLYALRKMGVTHVPMIIQTVSNPQLEMPMVYNTVLLDRLLMSERLPIFQDLFNDNLTITLKSKLKRKAVKVTWAIDNVVVPL